MYRNMYSSNVIMERTPVWYKNNDVAAKYIRDMTVITLLQHVFWKTAWISVFRTKRLRLATYHLRHFGYHPYLLLRGLLPQIHVTQFPLVPLPSVSHQPGGRYLHDGGHSHWEVLGSLLAPQLPPNEHGQPNAVHLLRCTRYCGGYRSQCSEVFRVWIRMEVSIFSPYLASRECFMSYLSDQEIDEIRDRNHRIEPLLIFMNWRW